MRRLPSWFFWGWVVAFLVAQQPFATGQVATDAPNLDFDRPAPIDARRSRAEAEDDAVTAGAYFAHGRLLEQRNDRSGALRSYQRAWRYDPDNQARLEEVVSLGFELQRSHVATRYALIAVERKPKDPILVRRLAIFLSKAEQNERAAKLFQLALEMSKDGGGPPSDLATGLLLLELGRLQFKNGDFVAAATTLGRVRDALLDPAKSGLGEENAKTILGTPEQTWGFLGEVFLKANRLDEASAAFKQADAAKGDAALLALRLARVEGASEKYAAAIEQLEHYFAKQETSAGKEPYQLLREWLGKLNPKPEQADKTYLEKLEQLAEKDATNLPLSLALGDAFAKAKNWSAADKSYRSLLEKSPSAEAYAGLVAVQTEAQDVPALAVTLADIAHKTGNLTAVADSLAILQRQEALVAQLIAHTKTQQMAEPPQLANGQLQAIGLLAIVAGKYDDADPLLQAAANAAKRKDTVFLPWGLALFRAEQPARAAKVFQQAIEEKGLPPKEATVYYYLAGALELSGQTDEALNAINTAIAKQPDLPSFLSRKGWILYHAKRLPAAEEVYTSLIKAFDKQHEDQDLREILRESRLVLSNICLLQDKYAAAVEWLEQVLDEYPDHPGALNDLSYVWSERGEHLERALKMADKAVKSDPKNRSYRDTLGWAYYQLQRYPEALRELEIAAADDAADGVIFEHLGDVLAKLNRVKEARTWWERSLPQIEKEGDMKRLNSVKAKLESQ